MKTNHLAGAGTMLSSATSEGANMKKWAGLAAAVFLAFLVTRPLSATTILPLTDQELVKKTDLIFQGVVVRIDNRRSRFRTASEAAVPHTFVTFRVERILKGKHTGQSNLFTLRFLGGPDSAARRFMRVEGCPDFDIGERVVLFVRRNERSPCPIAGWSQGRFRIINGEIFSDTGREVWFSPAGLLAFGPEHNLREVRTHHRGGNIFAYRVDGGGSSEGGAVQRMAGTRLSSTGFVNLVSKMVGALHTSAELSRLIAVTSMDPDEPFYFAQPRAVGNSAAQR